MSRKSARLVSSGYYDSDGKPVISYYEPVSRHFKRRKIWRSHTNNTRTSHMDSDSSDSYSRKHTMSQSAIVVCLFITVLGFGCFCRLSTLQDEMLILKEKMNNLNPESLPNFALYSLGAYVFQSSETYQRQKPTQKVFGIPVWPPLMSPDTVLQGSSPLVPGRCWPFAGGRGHIVIALSHRVSISHVTLANIPKNLSPTDTITSAPKEFSVYGMETSDGEGTRLGTFLYDEDGNSAQTFKLPEHNKGVFNHVKLQVESNWGDPDYSCLYSFQVHGKLAD